MQDVFSELISVSQDWDYKATEAHMVMCRQVPEHVSRLWNTGAQADTPEWV